MQTLSGKTVEARNAGDETLASLAEQTFGIDTEAAKIFAAHQANSQPNTDALKAERHPTEIQALPKFFELEQMHEATNVIAEALQAHKQVGVYGDYDADGNTASTIISQMIRDYTGKTPPHYIPWRKEGYGLNKPAIKKLHDEGAEVMIVVDCGTTSVAEVAYAKSLGMEVVIIDHHQPRPQDPLPDCPLVNPSRMDDAYPHKSLCAAGLSYIFARDLNIRLRQTDRYDLARKSVKGPLLVAAAIGTITDVMRLDNPVNRYLVQAGLAEMNSRLYPGINALMDIYGLKTVRESDIGFLIGPVFNAAGRMGQPDLGMQLLMTQDEREAKYLAKQLVHANNERKILTESTAAEAFKKAERYLKKHPSANFLMLDDPRWDKGIVGIVASRLKEHYGIPVALGSSYTGADGVARITYSVRSIPGVDFFHLALNPLIQSGDRGLLSGGGHAMAAGMTVTAEGRDHIVRTIEHSLTDATARARASDRLLYDQEKTLDDFQTTDFVANLYHTLGPVGTGVPAPRFLVRGVQIKRVSHMGPKGQDLDIVLGYPDRSNVILKHGVAFRTAGTSLGKALESDKRYSEKMDVIIEPYLFENDRGRLTVGYHVVDGFKPRPIKQVFMPRASKLEKIKEEARSRTLPPDITKFRSIADIEDPTNPDAQDALRILYEKKACLFDTETTGKNAGKNFRTNGITQIAALKVAKNSAGQYVPVIKEWHITPHKPSYFAYQTLDKAKFDLRYKPWDFEYIIDTQAQDVTDTEFLRANPRADIYSMRIGGEEVKGAKPFYAVASEVFDFFEGTVPYAYNAPFDMPVMATHWNAVAAEQPFKEFSWLKNREPHLIGEVTKQYETRFAKPLRERMAQHPELLQLFENPAHWHCAMYGALVHKGEARRNRLTNNAERYGITFSRDESKHDALEDVGPMVYMVADQTRHFGGAMDMRGLWEAELRKIHPAFTVEEYTHERYNRKDELIEKIPGQLKVRYPDALKNDPKIKAVAAFLGSYATVQHYNSKSRSMILDYDTGSQGNDPFFTLLNKNKAANAKTYWLPLLKIFAKWSISSELQQHDSLPISYPHITYQCYDYSSRADFTLTDEDGKETVIEDVPLGAYRRSEHFITRYDQRKRLDDYLQALRFLDRLEFTGIATITAHGIEVSGVQREFGDMTIAIPATMPISDFLTQNKDQIKDMLKISGIPMVRGTHMGDDPLNEDDKKLTQEEEHEQNLDENLKKAAIRLRTKVNFSPNPRVEMELSPGLLTLVGRHMTPPQQFTPNQQHLSGIYCETTDDPTAVRLSGNLEAFKEIGQHIRNASWLMYRFQTLPSVRASQTKLDEKTETLTLYCSPSPRTEDLWVLDRAHVPCHIYKDRIEINLRPLLHDPYHWYWEISKDLKFVKNNRKLVNKTPEPQALKDVAKALAEGTITAYHTNRDHDAWIDFSSMRNVPVNMKENGLLEWPTSNLQRSTEFPTRIAEIKPRTAPNIAHLLCDSVGHSQPQTMRFHEETNGTMHLAIPDYATLSQHFSELGDLYRKDLGQASISMHINPLLDAMRQMAEDPAMELPHRIPREQKAAAITGLHKKFQALLPQLIEMHGEAYEVWDAFKHTETQNHAFKEVAILDHLRLELLKQAHAFPENKTTQDRLAVVEHYFERISLAEFKKYRATIDLLKPSNNKNSDLLEDEGNNGAIPAIEKAFSYLGEEHTKADTKEAKLIAIQPARFAAMDRAEREKEYRALQRKIKKLTQSTLLLANGYSEETVLLTSYSERFVANLVKQASNVTTAITTLGKTNVTTFSDQQLEQRYFYLQRAYETLWEPTRRLRRCRDYLAQMDDHLPLQNPKDVAKARLNIAGGNPVLAPTPDFAAMDEYQLNNEYLAMKRAFTNLWVSTKKLHRTLLFTHEITNTGMLLQNPAERTKLAESAEFIHQTTENQLLHRMDYWQTRGLIENVTATDSGIHFKPTARFKADIAKYAQELLSMPEFVPTNPAENATSYPFILSKASLLAMLDAAHPLEKSGHYGILPMVRLWQNHEKGPLVLTDGLLQQLFESPVPLKPEDIFSRLPSGKWGAMIYPLPLPRHPQQTQIIEFVRTSLNQGAIFYTTPQAHHYINRLRQNPALQATWSTLYPTSEQRPLAELSDKELKNVLLTDSEKQQKLVQQLRRLKLDKNLDMQAASHAILRLNHDQPAMLPVVICDGLHPRAQMKAPLNDQATNGLGGKGYGAVISSHYLMRRLMQTASEHDAFLIHPGEDMDIDTYTQLAMTKTKPVASLLTPGDKKRKLQKFDGTRMTTLVPDEAWQDAFTKRADRLHNEATPYYDAMLEQYSPLHGMKQHLHPEAEMPKPVEVDGKDVSSLVGTVLQSPTIAATQLASLPPTQREEALAGIETRAKALRLDGLEWDRKMDELKRQLALPSTPSSPAYPDIATSFRDRYAKRSRDKEKPLDKAI